MRYILITPSVVNRIGDATCEFIQITPKSVRFGLECNVRASHMLENGMTVCRTHLGTTNNVDRAGS